MDSGTGPVGMQKAGTICWKGGLSASRLAKKKLTLIRTWQISADLFTDRPVRSYPPNPEVVGG